MWEGVCISPSKDTQRKGKRLAKRLFGRKEQKVANVFGEMREYFQGNTEIRLGRMYLIDMMQASFRLSRNRSRTIRT